MTITGKNRKKRKLGQAFFVKKTHTVAKPSLQNMVKELLTLVSIEPIIAAKWYFSH